MTKLLACSDIHNNVDAVRRLRARESNEYDAVILAGDIGSEKPNEIFEILRSFECPVLYIYGNWDSRLTYDRSFGTSCYHVHLAPHRVGDIDIVGESIDGIDAEFEAFVTATESRGQPLDQALTAYRERQRAKLSSIVASGAPERTVVVSHYRLTKTKGSLPGVPLFLFRHIHRFEDTSYRGQRFVNVSALDKKVMVVRKDAPAKSEDYRFLNAGGYIVISHSESAGFTIESRRFDPDFSDWQRIDGMFFSSATGVE